MPNERPDHARPSGGPDPDALWDDALRTLTHAEHAKTITSLAKSAALCTLSQKEEGYPYGSLVTFALFEGEPLFLISRLAEHTKNLLADPRASLLVSEERAGNPLALGRVTFIGDVRAITPGEEVGAREAFLAAHPSARGYVEFRDFGFFRLQVRSVRYIGGFGRMSFVDPGGFRDAEPDPIAPIAAGIVEHMNRDHEDALVAIARTRTRATEATEVVMTGVDRYGFELRVGMPSGERPARVVFDEPIADAETARKAMIALVRAARGD